MDLTGFGPSGAARLLVEVGDITRFPDNNHFGSWTGTAPIDASSGDNVRHRLSRGGNRQINRVLHIVAVVQLRRLHHRMKTHGAWTYTMVEPGVFLWRSSYGYTWLRDHAGTADLTPPPVEPPASHPSDSSPASHSAHAPGTRHAYASSMSTPAEVGLKRWHDVIESGDPSRLPAIIAEDAVFRSPAVHTPQEGRDLVTAYLAGAMKVLGTEFRYDDEWVRERDAVLLFASTVDGLQVQGIDLIRWDDAGQIVDFTVMIRPFKALQVVMGRMLEELTSKA
jgi:hypothetical protein